MITVNGNYFFFTDHLITNLQGRFSKDVIENLITNPQAIIQETPNKFIFYRGDKAVVVKKLTPKDRIDIKDSIINRDILKENKTYMIITILTNFDEKDYPPPISFNPLTESISNNLIYLLKNLGVVV